MSLIDQSLERITTEEDLKLRYMYQIRKYKEVSDDLIPARIYHLNQLYSMMFLKNGSLNEAIALTKDSLELLKRHLNSQDQFDDLVGYYHVSTWHQLVVSNSSSSISTSYLSIDYIHIIKSFIWFIG